MSAGASSGGAARLDARGRYFLAVLLLVNTFNYLDRQVINILAEPIRNELGLKDWQLGALTGLAFALLYTIAGLPIARLAERVHRPTLLGLSVGVWGGFTMLCGAAQTFWQLALCRLGVGLGEAGATPISHSLIIDRVPKQNRAMAIGVFQAGTSLGALFGMALGGLIADQYGWRMAFLVAGAPGIVLAIIAALTLAEPRGGSFRADLKKLAAPRADTPKLRDGLRELFAKKSFPLIAFGAATGGLVGFVHSAFFAAFLLRVHGEQLARLADEAGAALGFPLGPLGFVGLALGIVSGVTGVFGVVLGGWIADRAARRGPGAYMVIPAMAKFAAAPIAVAALLVGDVVVALAIMAVMNVVRSLSHGPGLASVYALVRPELRPTAAAVLVFVVAVIGLGIGPLAVGLLSDALAGSGMGEAEGLRVALICAEAAGILGAVLFLIARPIYVREATS